MLTIDDYLPQPMTEIDTDMSQRTRRAVKAKYKQCYKNAWRAILYVPELEDARYVEGHAVFGDGMVIEHGWIENAGRVIEPTNEGITAYFAGIRYTRQEALDQARNAGAVPIAWHKYGWGGYGHPGMLGSMVAAYEWAASQGLIIVAPEVLAHHRAALVELLTT